MENAIQPFKFKDHEVRTVVIEDAPFWVAKDVAEVLGYANISDAISKHCKGVAKRYPLQTAGGVQEMRVIGEPDLYRLIAHSNLPAAVEFEAWIFDEVLPTIRRTGGYIQANDNETPEEIMARALIVAKATIDTMAERIKNHKARIAEQKAQIQDQQAQIEGQQAQIEEAKPKVLFADAVSSSHNCILIGELAKILRQNNIDIGQNRLFQWLRKHGWLIRRHGADYNMPTQKAVEKGVFEIKERAINNPDGTVFVTKTTVVTGKGQVYFVNRFLKGQGAMEPA